LNRKVPFSYTIDEGNGFQVMGKETIVMSKYGQLSRSPLNLNSQLTPEK
jgi:hypothetical protein